MPFYDKVIALAKTQVGYREGYSKGSWNNDQKYSDEVPGFKWSDFQPWCATFNTWLDYKLGITTGAGDTKNSPCTASVRAAYEWGVKNGRFTEYPVIGAWVIFNKTEHTERCIAYDSTYVWTIGGNTLNTYAAQGNGVYEKKYKRTETRITGYVVPVFPDSAYKSPDPKWNKVPTATPASKPKPFSSGAAIASMLTGTPKSHGTIIRKARGWTNTGAFKPAELEVILKGCQTQTLKKVLQGILGTEYTVN